MHYSRLLIMISRKEGQQEMIIGMFKEGIDISVIAKVAGMGEDEIEQILCNSVLTSNNTNPYKEKEL